MKKLLFILLCLFALTGTAQEVSLIPQPARMKVNEGKFLFRGKVVLCYPKIKDSGIDAVVDNFVDEMKSATGIKIAKDRLKSAKKYGFDVLKNSKKGDAHIVLSVDEAMGDEAYRLSVSAKRIDITAAKPAGFFYAFQTLKQLMPRNVMAGVYTTCFTMALGLYDCLPTEYPIPCVEIEDKPRFSWRGFMLDEGRHFYGKEEIKKLLDVMAAYKMNLNDNCQLVINAGPYVAYGLFGSDIEWSNSDKTNVFDACNRFEAGVGAGAKVVFERASVGVDFNRAFTKAFDDVKAYSQVIGLTFGYKF